MRPGRATGAQRLMPGDTFSRSSVSAALARRIIEGGVDYATEIGKAFTIAVVDESGVLKARYEELVGSLETTPEAVQKAHLNFLNTLLQL